MTTEEYESVSPHQLAPVNVTPLMYISADSPISNKDTETQSKSSPISHAYSDDHDEDEQAKSTCTQYLKIQIKNTYVEFIEWTKTQHPAFLFILLCISLVIVISGAIVFFIFTGALNSDYTEFQIFWMGEVNFQILTICFTIICIYVFPERLINFYNVVVVTHSIGSQNSREIYYNDLMTKFPRIITMFVNDTHIKISPSISSRNSINIESRIAENTTQNDLLSLPSLEMVMSRTWFKFRIFAFVGILHCLMQYVVAGYMLYINAYNRPLYFVGIVAPTMVIGCAWGAWEGYLKSIPKTE